MKKISVIVPCYGSEHTIEGVVTEITQTIDARLEYDYEILLVNDSSPDNVLAVIKEIALQNNKVKGFDLAKNFGQHAALMAGFQNASGDIIVCLDDDGQTPANEMFLLIDQLENGYDLVFARYGDKKHSLFRNFGSFINERMARSLLNKPKGLAIMSYFACKRFVIEEAKRYHNPYPYVTGLLLRATKKITNVDIKHRQRQSGKSGYTFKKLFTLWLNGFTAFSIKPLRFATLMGFFCAGSGFVYGAYIVIKKLLNPNIPVGYSSTMAVLLFISGVIMLILGLIGEYLGRIYISINNSPQFVIRESINMEEKE